MTEGDWKEWLENPFTVIYRRLLLEEASELDDTMYDPSSVEKTALKCAFTVGFGQAIERALELEPEFDE